MLHAVRETPLIPHRPPDEVLAALHAAGLLDDEARRRGRAAIERTGADVAVALLELGLVPERDLFAALADIHDLPFAEGLDLDPEAAQHLGVEPDYLARVGVVPVRTEDGAGGALVLAAGRLDAADAIEAIAHFVRRPVRVALAAPSAVRAALERLSQPAEETDAATADVDRLRALANDGPVVTLVNDLLGRAVAEHASDVHIEAEEAGLRVRYRIDGVLRTVRRIADADRAAVASRLKVMAGLNISERRRPQDGRIRIAARGRDVDLRLSTLPTQHGESIVLRVLDRARVRLDLPSLGFDAPTCARLEAVAALPHGLFLISGPTGSGKTTTLYALLSRVDAEAKKVVTVEDPIEYALPGVAQVQVDPKIGLTFGGALRAILRQDPNVVMVGEIRDEETAEIAVRAAQIGRLVLSTIHTSTPHGAIARLGDLGVPQYLIEATLKGVMGQRLEPLPQGGRTVAAELVEYEGE